MGNSFTDALRYGFHGVEVYNDVCRWHNGKSDGTAYWNKMLEKFPDTLAFASDDAHLRPGHPTWNGGWIVVNAPELSREAILEGIRQGNFYSSCGPTFHSIEYDGERIAFTTSPIQFARLAGPSYSGLRMGSADGMIFIEGTFQAPQDWPYVYLEIEDAQGRRAWTNPLFWAD
jgi:hypothetical protein